jgi:DNA polymerase-1
MSWLNCEWESHRLEDLVVKYKIDEDAKGYKKEMQDKARKLGGYDKVPPAEMEPYACRDVEETYQLLYFLIDSLKKQDLFDLLGREFEFARQLLDMEWYGLGVDLSLCQELSEQADARMRQLEDEIGFDPLKNLELARRLCLGAPVGLGLIPEALTNTTSPEFPHGIPALRREWLAKHMTIPLVANVIEYKGLVKANSTWFKGFCEHAGKTRDSRLHTTFNGSSGSRSKSGVQGKSSTVTGRLNSNGPNLQQIPRQDELDSELKRQVKRVFVPGRQRWGLWEFDYSQIEARLAVGYADATALIDAFRNGEDIHVVTSQRIGCSRQTAKQALYTMLYGGGADTLAATIERLEFQTTGKIITYSVSDAQDIIDGVYQLAPGLKSLQREAGNLIRRRGYVSMWNGRRRHYERWYDPNLKKQVDNGHKAFNSVIQGGAAEIIKSTMLNLPRKDFAYRVVSQVHDSLWIEIVRDNTESYIDDIKWSMEWPSRDERFKLPFPVDVKLINHEAFNQAAFEAEFGALA